MTITEAKREQRRIQHELDAPRKAQRRREIRCFWTFPLGHQHERTTGRCAGCNMMWDTLGPI